MEYKYKFSGALAIIEQSHIHTQGQRGLGMIADAEKKYGQGAALGRFLGGGTHE